MYNEEYFAKTARSTHIRLYIVIAMMVLACVGVGVCCALRLQTPNLIIAGVGYAAVYFVWDLKLTPWLRYNKFMKEMKHGQKRQLEVEFMSMDSDTRIYDGVEVYDIQTRVGDRDEDLRTYVYDADMPRPELKPGQRIKVTSFGMFVVDISAC